MHRRGRVLGYCRVSGAEQGRHGTSLDGQRAELTRHCELSALPAPTFYVEVESASAEKLERRVELARLLAAALPGDVVLVCSVDRWSRDIVYGVRSVRELVARGIGWRSVRESIDASTPHGDSTLGIMAWVADQERRRIRDRTVGRRKALRDEGAYVEGAAPFGYRRGERPARRLVVDAGEARIVREAFRRCIAGSSASEIAEWLRLAAPERGAWDHSMAHRLCRKRIYLGELQDSRGVWRAAHEPIVDRATFDAAARALTSRRLGGRRAASPRTEDWLLRGLASCGLCGARMGAAYSPGAEAGRVELHYYACARRLARRTCSAPYLRVDDVDAAVGALALERLVALRRELGRPGVVAPAVDRSGARARLAARRQRVGDAIEAGTLSTTEARARLERIDREREALDAADEAEARARTASAPAARRALLADVRHLARLWERGTVPERREIVRQLAARITLCAGAAPAIDWRHASEL